MIEDNYNGVTLWENADRYCGSPANTSTGYCTLVNPSVAKISTCTAKNIDKEPYYSDCRWKTQNVKVHHNSFKMNRANFFNCAENMCGRNAIFSNYGSSPSWSPYNERGHLQGDHVQPGQRVQRQHLHRHLELHHSRRQWAGLVERLAGGAFGQDGGSALTG